MSDIKKNAIILFNLGGPSKLSEVKDFLFNLFYDPAIIRLPNPFRWCLAKFISSTRKKKSQAIYSKIGGKSPILEITKRQGELLEKELNGNKKKEFKVFVSMRYAAPRITSVIKELERYNPTQVLLLPLYPQYSTTTTKSSFDEFYQLFASSSLRKIPVKEVLSYYSDPLFIKACKELLLESIAKATEPYRILFSAHGLPESIIKAGDPYQQQIEATVNLVVEALNIKDLNYVVCYQSKVGRLKWLEPSTETELMRAAKDDVAVIVMPIAFVSDHSETLVELDIDYKELFAENCQKQYLRVAALNYNKDFVKCLVNQVFLNS